MTLVRRDATNFRHPIEVVDSNGAVVTGLTYLSTITFAFKRPTDASWVAVTVIEGTADHADGGFRELDSGVYEFCWPDAAIVADEATLIRYTYDGVNRVDVIEARLVANANIDASTQASLAATIAGTVAADTRAAILPSANTFTGTVDRGGRRRIVVVQRDDHNAADGTAYEFPYTNAAIDFTDTEIVAGAAGGENAFGDRVTGAASIQARADGSCNIRLEFTSAQLNVPAGPYNFDIHIVTPTRRITTTQLDLIVDPKQADEPPA